MNGKIADLVNFDDAEYCSVIQTSNNILLGPLTLVNSVHNNNVYTTEEQI